MNSTLCHSLTNCTVYGAEICNNVIGLQFALRRIKSACLHRIITNNNGIKIAQATLIVCANVEIHEEVGKITMVENVVRT